MYIAKEIREAIGKKNVEMIGVGKVIIMYPNGASTEDVWKSVDMALKTLELEVGVEKNNDRRALWPPKQ